MRRHRHQSAHPCPLNKERITNIHYVHTHGLGVRCHRGLVGPDKCYTIPLRQGSGQIVCCAKSYCINSCPWGVAFFRVMQWNQIIVDWVDHEAGVQISQGHHTIKPIVIAHLTLIQHPDGGRKGAAWHSTTLHCRAYMGCEKSGRLEYNCSEVWTFGFSQRAGNTILFFFFKHNSDGTN